MNVKQVFALPIGAFIIVDTNKADFCAFPRCLFAYFAYFDHTGQIR